MHRRQRFEPAAALGTITSIVIVNRFESILETWLLGVSSYFPSS